MKRYGIRCIACNPEECGKMLNSARGEYLRRDEVIDALIQSDCDLGDMVELYEVLESLGITEEEYQAAVDRNHPGPDPDYNGSSVLDYSRGVR